MVKNKKQKFNLIIIAEVESLVIRKDKAIIDSPEMGWKELLQAVERGDIKIKIKKVNYK